MNVANIFDDTIQKIYTYVTKIYKQLEKISPNNKKICTL